MLLPIQAELDQAMQRCRAYRKSQQFGCMAIVRDLSGNWLYCLRYRIGRKHGVSFLRWIDDAFKHNQNQITVELSFGAKHERND